MSSTVGACGWVGVGCAQHCHIRFPRVGLQKTPVWSHSVGVQYRGCLFVAWWCQNPGPKVRIQVPACGDTEWGKTVDMMMLLIFRGSCQATVTCDLFRLWWYWKKNDFYTWVNSQNQRYLIYYMLKGCGFVSVIVGCKNTASATLLGKIEPGTFYKSCPTWCQTCWVVSSLHSLVNTFWWCIKML